MSILSRIILLSALIPLASCTDSTAPDNGETEKTTEMKSRDVHSFADPSSAAVRHLSLDLKVDFENKTLSGDATLQIEREGNVKEVILDTRNLTIHKVTDGDGNELSFELGEEAEHLGRALKVTLPDDSDNITVNYTTSPDAEALQWLSPAQTAGKEHPFLFTQSQAILARTWIPIQDSPGVKFTYDATIRCPEGLMTLMSAENDTVLHNDGVYMFRMPQPIPSYLMALSVGDLAFSSLGGNCGVFAEPSMIEKSAWEFEDLSRMISSAEELYGPYEWGRYDILVLPPSFPFGGMENPRITFATPTIIAGDRSLVALVAHELAHSWSGNLVTNATWNDFWLNEGFTVYFESRIMEKIYGREYSLMLTKLGLMDVTETIAELGADHPDTHLYLELEGRNPDDGVTDIAYEKGRFFLTTIEHAVGRETWDQFLSKYFEEHAWGTMTTEQFIAYLDTELFKGDTVLRQQINPEAWIYGPGMPDNCPVIVSAELDKAGASAASFNEGGATSDIDTSGWTTHHWLYFLRKLSSETDRSRLAELDAAFNLTNSGNSEIQCEWYQISISSGYEEAYPAIESFLMNVGRRKFLKPIYTAMSKTPQGLEMAKRIYHNARPGYHSVSTQTIDELLKYDPSTAGVAMN